MQSTNSSYKVRKAGVNLCCIGHNHKKAWPVGEERQHETTHCVNRQCTVLRKGMTYFLSLRIEGLLDE